MKLATLARRPLWLLALPLFALPSPQARAQDDAPAPPGITQPADGAPDAAPGDDQNPLPDDGGVVDDAGTDFPSTGEPDQKPIDTLDFAAYLQSLGGTTQLELSLDKATLAQVAAAIEKGSGVRVEVSPQWEAYPDSRISAKVAKANLWDALGQLKARGVDAQWIGPTRSLQLLPLADASQAKIPPRNPLSQELGAASLGVTRVQRTRALLFPSAAEGGEKSDRFEMELLLRPDPRWRTIEGTASWAGLTLIDAKGKAHAVLPDSAGGTVEGAQAAFDAKGIDTSGPATIKGELRFAVVAKSQKWSLADLAKPAKLDIQRDGAPVRYEYLGSSDASGALTLKFAASNAPDVPGTVIALPSPDPSVPSANLPLYHFAGVGSGGGIRLLGADGASVDFLEASSGLQSAERSEFEVQTVPNITTGQATTPTKAEVDVPLEWREVRVPFEIKNVPLP